MGASVLIVGRNRPKTEAAAHRIIAETGNSSVGFLLADLSSQAEVRALAQQVQERTPRLDVLLNNAGAIFLSSRSSVDGIEMTFALNHLGYFLLTTLLLDLLKGLRPRKNHQRIFQLPLLGEVISGWKTCLTRQESPGTGPMAAPSSATSSSPTNWPAASRAAASR